MTVAAVLLCAGAGSRFAGATHKLLADLDGRPGVCHALDAVLAAGFDEVIVVDGAVDLRALVPVEATLVHNDDWAQGQSSSLRVAVQIAAAGGHEAVVVGLGDQPRVRTEAWRRVADTVSPIAVALYGTQRRNPVRLSREVWPLLPTEGDHGARSVIASYPDLVADVACEGDPFDVDTVEDLHRLKQ